MSDRLNYFRVGVDDTDSSDGMCTTFLCYSAVKKLLKSGKSQLLDYPRLIRLNPNIPWKTRGNAGLSLLLRTELSHEEVFEFYTGIVRKYATSPRANSGLVILEGLSVPREVEDFSKRALFSIMSLREARSLAHRFQMKTLELRGGQGLVGALASIGNQLRRDHTFELIAYRKSVRSPRRIELGKIVEMSRIRFPSTFSNYDDEFGRVMILPHGPDPVLCGIRGESPMSVLRAFRDLLPVGNFLGHAIFRSNQGTGEHLSHKLDLGHAIPYSSGTVSGKVVSLPRMEQGGHVFFELGNEDGEISCASYEPTADFRKAVMALAKGDLVRVAGGIRKPTSLHTKVLNLELLRPMELLPQFSLSNPACPNCGITLKSQGKNQGFKCRKCDYFIEGIQKDKHLKPREISPKLYLPPVKAHRHLTKPLHRYKIRRKEFRIPVKLIDGWLL